MGEARLTSRTTPNNVLSISTVRTNILLFLHTCRLSLCFLVILIFWYVFVFYYNSTYVSLICIIKCPYILLVLLLPMNTKQQITFRKSSAFVALFFCLSKRTSLQEQKSPKLSTPFSFSILRAYFSILYDNYFPNND